MIGLAAVLVGFIPKVAGLIWLHLGYAFFCRLLRGSASRTCVDG